MRAVYSGGGKMPNDLIGWHLDISNDDYHKGNGISSSNLKQLLDYVPERCAWNKLNPREATPSMQLGTLVHAMILEPDSVEKEFAVMPDFQGSWQKTNPMKADFIAQNPNKTIVTKADYDTAIKMRDSAMRQTTVERLLGVDAVFVAESSAYWYQEIAENEWTMLKCRPDALCGNYRPFVVDLKTGADATISGFQQAIIKYAYHLSAAMYMDGINQTPAIANYFGYSFTHFIWVVIENTPPYSAAIYQPDSKVMAMGRKLYEISQQRFAAAKSNGWPGFLDEIQLIDLPPYGDKIKTI